MTEYDYSPEAYEKFIATQHRIAKWVDNTDAHAHEFEAPAVPPLSGRPKAHKLKRRRSLVAPMPQNVMMQPGVMSYVHRAPMIYAPVPGPMPSPAMQTGFTQPVPTKGFRPSPPVHGPLGYMQDGLPKPSIHSPSSHRHSHKPQRRLSTSSDNSVTPSMSASMVGARQQMHMMFQSPPPSPLATPPPMMYPNQVPPVYSYSYAPAAMPYGYSVQSPLTSPANYMVMPPGGQSVKVYYI